MYKDYTNFCLGIECVNSHWKGDRSGAGVMYKRLPPAASCPKKVAPGLKPQNFPFWPHFIYGLPPYTHPLRQPASSRVFQNAQLCLATIHRKPLPAPATPLPTLQHKVLFWVPRKAQIVRAEICLSFARKIGYWHKIKFHCKPGNWVNKLLKLFFYLCELRLELFTYPGSSGV